MYLVQWAVLRFSFEVAAVLRDEWMWLKLCLIFQNEWSSLFLYIGNTLV